jgi:hypothetical protein
MQRANASNACCAFACCAALPLPPLGWSFWHACVAALNWAESVSIPVF